jgi:predicted GIY-YIG superfamily endonuclease
MSKYIIYKIYCDDCDYIYVGSTKNFTRRKQQHKINCNQTDKYNMKLYKTINEYGGWNNWKMICIEECDETIISRRQAEQKEEEWRDKLKPQIKIEATSISEEKKIDNPKYVIYKIYCDDSDFIYVGSTKNFTRRKQEHKMNCNKSDKSNMKVYKTINEYGGWNNWKMICIEECDETIITTRQAQQKEEEWRLKLKALLNSHRAYIPEEKKSEYYKLQRKEYRAENNDKIKEKKLEYYENNKEEIREKQQEYRNENRNKINEQKREHYHKNKEELLEKVKKYKEENKDIISEKKKLKVKCNCGVIFRKEDKSRHFRSVFHQNYISSNPNVEINLEIIET